MAYIFYFLSFFIEISRLLGPNDELLVSSSVYPVTSTYRSSRIMNCSRKDEEEKKTVNEDNVLTDVRTVLDRHQIAMQFRPQLNAS